MTLADFDLYRFLSDRARVRLMVYAGLAALALGLGMSHIGGSLKTGGAPWGIISLELAHTPDQAQAVLASWDAGARVDAGLVVGLDFVFALSYVLFLSLMCMQLAGQLYSWHRVAALVGVVLSWAVVLAGVADVVENVALIQMLRGSELPLWPTVAYWSAVPKFVTILLSVVFCFWGWLFYLNSVALHQFREGMRAAGAGAASSRDSRD